MRIALYLKHFPATGAPLNQGTSIAVGGLASGLAANGAQVTVLCEGPTRSSVKAERGYAVECFVNQRPYRTFMLAPGLRRYVGEHLAPRGGLCLVNGMFHPGVYAMGHWLRRHGVPYVVAPHGPYDPAVFGTNGHLKWPYWYLFERALLQQASAIQVLDARHGECLRELGIGTHIIETPNGVAESDVPAEHELRWCAATEPARLVFFGRLDAYNKGLDILIDAIPPVAALADVRLTIQGPDGGDRARLEAQAAAGMAAGKIVFRGPDYQRCAPRIVGDHDVFCLPSRFEGFGLAALEAMLAARVLLVSGRAGIARHVQASGCGAIAEPTVAGVVEGLFTLLRRRAEWRDMGLAGRRYALTKLQWKDIAAAALAQYEGLVA